MPRRRAHTCSGERSKERLGSEAGRNRENRIVISLSKTHFLPNALVLLHLWKRRNAAPIATPTRVEARYPFSRYPTGHAFWATQSCMYLFDWYSADTADRSRTITTNWAKAITSVVSTPSVFLMTVNPLAPICLCGLN